MTDRLHPEEALQRACVQLLRLCPAPPEGPSWNAVNPVPAKSKAAAGKSKAMGLRSGWPDLLLVWKGRAITIELKAGRGRTSPAQDELRKEITLAGGVWAEVRSLEEFAGLLGSLGIPCPVRIQNERAAEGARTPAAALTSPTYTGGRNG